MNTTKLKIYYNAKSKSNKLYTYLKLKNEPKEIGFSVYFVKELKAELETNNIDINKPFNLTIDVEGLGYDMEKKNLFIRYKNPKTEEKYFMSIDYDVEPKKQRPNNFEATPKFDEVFECASDDESNNDSVKF